jgi:hypothetical protein
VDGLGAGHDQLSRGIARSDNEQGGEAFGPPRRSLLNLLLVTSRSDRQKPSSNGRSNIDRELDRYPRAAS